MICAYCGGSGRPSSSSSNDNNNTNDDIIEENIKASTLKVCGRCRNIAYCCKDHQVKHWKQEHKQFCKFIPGTKVIRDTAATTSSDAAKNDEHATTRTENMENEELDTTLTTAATRTNPIPCTLHLSYTSRGNERARLVYCPGPGSRKEALADIRNTPTTTPSGSTPNQLVPLPSGRFRHISTFTRTELQQVGWDGSSRYSSSTCQGEWVPFIAGYDSDEDHNYEPIPSKLLEAQKQAGIVGIFPETGVYVTIPDTSGFYLLQNPSPKH